MCLPLFALYYWFGSLELEPVYGGQYFTYDETGNLTERCYEGSYNADSRIFFSYDEENNLIRISEEDAQGAKKTLVADTSLLSDSRLEDETRFGRSGVPENGNRLCWVLARPFRSFGPKRPK